MSGTELSSHGLDPRRRRILFRCWHRGTREMDLILGRFADAVLPGLGESELDEFERLMDLPDPDLYAFATGEAQVPSEFDSPVFGRLRAFHRGPGATL